ncbi:RILP-like protein 2 [Amblyraja radiata]|uniref:RILP-like protein 2 n=1 Tax=Amblyraja radiata TaxID=386614 RepID=UPI001401F946|nr:RILP-like protein 2 [Amblyraja radiata]
MQGAGPPFNKDPLELAVEDVYDISHQLGCQFREVNSSQSSMAVFDLQFQIVRVLKMLESLVSQSSVSLEELRLERDGLKAEAETLIGELRSKATDPVQEQNIGAAKFIMNLKDPNCPRFTLQELSEVLHERNHLKAQLLTTRAAIQCYQSATITQAEEGDGEPCPNDGSG